MISLICYLTDINSAQVKIVFQTLTLEASILDIIYWHFTGCQSLRKVGIHYTTSKCTDIKTQGIIQLQTFLNGYVENLGITHLQTLKLLQTQQKHCLC